MTKISIAGDDVVGNVSGIDSYSLKIVDIDSVVADDSSRDADADEPVTHYRVVLHNTSRRIGTLPNRNARISVTSHVHILDKVRIALEGDPKSAHSLDRAIADCDIELSRRWVANAASSSRAGTRER